MVYSSIHSYSKQLVPKFTYMILADVFFQSNLHILHSRYIFYQMHFLGIELRTLFLLSLCSLFELQKYVR